MGFPACLQDDTGNVKECHVQDLISVSATLQQLVKDAGTGTHNMIYRFQHFLIQCELNCSMALRALSLKNQQGNRHKSGLLSWVLLFYTYEQPSAILSV